MFSLLFFCFPLLLAFEWNHWDDDFMDRFPQRFRDFGHFDQWGFGHNGQRRPKALSALRMESQTVSPNAFARVGYYGNMDESEQQQMSAENPRSFEFSQSHSWHWSPDDDKRIVLHRELRKGPMVRGIWVSVEEPTDFPKGVPTAAEPKPK